MTFIESTRQTIQQTNFIPYVQGQPAFIEMARAGYLATIWLRFKGKLNCTHPSKTSYTPAPLAPYTLINRLQVVINGNQTVWSTSGVGAYLQNITNAINYVMDQPGNSAAPFSVGTAVSAAGADNDVIFTLKLNVSINDRDTIGLIQLQNDATALKVQVEAAGPGALMTDTDITSTLSGVWEILTETFTIPAEPENRPVLAFLHQVIEQGYPINNNGVNSQLLQRGNTYRRLINFLQLNGQPADALERLSLTYNQTTTHYDMFGSSFKVLQRERYGRDLPAGAYVWDLTYQGIPNMPGNRRDLIDSSRISELMQRVTVADSAVLGANNNRLSIVSDQLVRINPSV